MFDPIFSITLSSHKTETGSEKMPGLLKCLLHKPEDLNLILRANLEVARACHPRDGNVKRRGKRDPWMLAEQLSQPTL